VSLNLLPLSGLVPGGRSAPRAEHEIGRRSDVVIGGHGRRCIRPRIGSACTLRAGISC